MIVQTVVHQERSPAKTNVNKDLPISNVNDKNVIAPRDSEQAQLALISKEVETFMNSTSKEEENSRLQS